MNQIADVGVSPNKNLAVKLFSKYSDLCD